jgi:hypothetical protein
MKQITFFLWRYINHVFRIDDMNEKLIPIEKDP